MPTVRALDIAFKVFMACMWLMLWGIGGLWFSIPTLAIFVIRGIVKSREPNIPQLIQQYSDNESQHLDNNNIFIPKYNDGIMRDSIANQFPD